MDETASARSDIELYYGLKGEKETSERAFSELYNRYSARLYAYCLRILGNRDDARDVFQEAFIRFFQSAQSERTMTNVPAYLMRIARNLCLNSKRDNKTVFPMNDIQLPTTDTPYERTELLGLVATALDALPTEYREVFVLREYDGRSYSEISDITEAPLTTVKIRLFRARARLRKILAPYIADFAE